MFERAFVNNTLILTKEQSPPTRAWPIGERQTSLCVRYDANSRRVFRSAIDARRSQSQRGDTGLYDGDSVAIDRDRAERILKSVCSVDTESSRLAEQP